MVFVYYQVIVLYRIRGIRSLAYLYRNRGIRRQPSSGVFGGAFSHSDVFQCAVVADGRIREGLVRSRSVSVCIYLYLAVEERIVDQSFCGL
jgi:hypothetical protein